VSGAANGVLPPWWRSVRIVLVAALAGLWTLLFAGAGVLAYRMVRGELESAMGGQLAAAARLLAGQVQALRPRSAAIEPGSGLDPALARVLEGVRGSGLAEDLVVISPRGLVLVDATGEAVPGFEARGLDAGDWALLRRGSTVIHAPARGGFGTLSQSVFTPLSDGSVLELRADPAYLAALERFRRASLWAGSLGLALSALLGAALAAWILSPLKWLESAARGEAPPGAPRGGHELALAARNVAGSLRSLAEENLEARLLREHAERRGEELRQVASAIAHEVRNPLAVIRGQADLLARTLSAGGPAPAPLDRIREQVGRLDEVVGRFLELGRLPRLDVRDLDLTALLGGLAESLRQGAAPGTWTVALEAPPSLRARADPALLEGALLNLGLNALQAMPGGGRVVLSLRLEGLRVVFDVADEGPGFAPEVRGRLFQPFFTTKAAGSGLGLALARRSAQAHGGDLEALDSPGGGALLRLWIPFQADEA